MSTKKHSIPDELVTQLLGNYQKPEDLIGENGLLKQLTKLLVEKALDAEMAQHLGHDKHEPVANATGNTRNGKRKKTLKGDFPAQFEVRGEVYMPRSGFEAMNAAIGEDNLEREKAVQEAVRTAITDELVASAHDCSDGGLAVALAECCFSSYRRPAVGATVDLDFDLDATTLLFGEAPSRVVASAPVGAVAKIAEICRRNGVACRQIGIIGGDRLRIEVRGATAIDAHLSVLERAWRSRIAAAMAVGK